MANNNNYLESAPIGMALMDAVPVLFFCGSVFFIGSIFNSALFMVGAVLCIAAGTCKVLWKLLLATAHKNVLILNRQFRYVMSGGFLIMIIALIVEHKRVSFPLIWKNNCHADITIIN